MVNWSKIRVRTPYPCTAEVQSIPHYTVPVQHGIHPSDRLSAVRMNVSEHPSVL